MCQASPRTDCRLALLDPLGPWRAGAARPADFSSCIDRLEQLTPDLMGLSLAVSEPVAADAGQFMLLAAPQVEGFRAYSMANGEASTRRPDFIVKRQQGGAFTRWLFTEARPGDAVRLFGPLGSAVSSRRWGSTCCWRSAGPGSRRRCRSWHGRRTTTIWAATLPACSSASAACRTRPPCRRSVPGRSVSAPRSRRPSCFRTSQPPLPSRRAGRHCASRQAWSMTPWRAAWPARRRTRWPSSPALRRWSTQPRRVMMLKGRLPPSRIRYDRFT